MSLKPKSIDRDACKTIISRYARTVPAKLLPLEDFRNKLPGILKRRVEEDGDAWLEKEELTKLVEWKLSVKTLSSLVPRASPASC
jgi:hypothetical protein